MKYTGRLTLLLLILVASVTQLILAKEYDPLAIIFSCIYAGIAWIIGGLYDKYHFLSYNDHLTKVHNRRYGYKVIPRILSMAKVKKEPVAIFNIDIDNFKCINDNYGHEYGDFMLKELCHVLLNNIRKSDLLIRWGGDEFLVIYRNVTRETAAKLVHRLNENVNDELSKYMRDKNLEIRLSIGIAIYPEDGQSIDKLVAISNEKMYEVKASSKGHSFR